MIGEALSHYRITAKLGEGGMGEVYRAEDNALGREVAIKILPEAFSSDPGRLARFEREARALAALDHPNIVHIYSVEEADGVRFITMQLVEGECLSKQIPEGGMAIERFLTIALPIVDALRVAHDKGVTHRDLKPENLMIDREGRARILDFGLAKLRASDAAASDSQLPTEAMTQEGMVVGTVPYMSPEQVQGLPLDPRTDLFSLGVVFYEMVTGRRPFSGKNAASLISSILRDRPAPVYEIRRELPTRLSRILTACLEKDPEDRISSAAALYDELAELQRSLSATSPAEIEAVVEQVLAGKKTAKQEASSRRLGRPAGLVMGVILAMIAAYFGYRNLSDRGEPETFVPGPISYRQLTSQPGAELQPSLSPDGKWTVYSGEATSGQDIYLQSVGGQTAINLTEDSPGDDTQPAFSPDGESIVFRSSRDGGGLFVMGRTGEAVRRITREGFNPSWSPDGRRIAYSTENVTLSPENWDGHAGLWVAEVDSGDTRSISERDGVQPSWSPDGRRIAYTSRIREPAQMDIWTLPLDGGEPAPVTDDIATDWSPVWSPDGRHIYFASDRGGSMNLWRIRVDQQSGEALGEAEPITTPATFLAHLSLAADGRTVAYNSVLITQNIQRLEMDPATGEIVDREPGWVTSGSIPWSSPDPSPDGKSVVFYSRVRPEGDLYVARVDGTGLRQLTRDEAIDRVPRWSPDGEWISYFSNRSGDIEVWKVRPDGSDQTQITALGSGFLPAWSPDSRRLAATHFAESGSVLVDPELPATRQTIETLPKPPGDRGPFFVNSWSPDGSRLAGQIGMPGKGIEIFSLGSGQYEQLTEFGEWPVWLPDSRRLLFVHGGKEFHLVDRESKVSRQVFSVPRDVIGPPRISIDGRTVYFSRRVTEADVWILSLP